MARLSALIDPLALLLPESIYVIVAEARHPHEPITEVLDKAFEGAGAHERAEAQRRVEVIIGLANAVKNAAAGRAQEARS